MIKTKKFYTFLAIITALLMLFAGISVLLGAVRTNTTNNVFATADSGNGWSYDGNGKLTITSNDAWEYFDSNRSNFQHYNLLTTIEIGDDVTNIPEMAFKKCKALTNVTIGKNVRYFGDEAFYADNNENEPELPILNVWLEATKEDLIEILSPAEAVAYFACGGDSFNEFKEDNEYATLLVEAIENYDSSDESTFNNLKHVYNLACTEYEEGDDYEQLIEDTNWLIGVYNALCDDNPEEALTDEDLNLLNDEISDLLNFLNPNDVVMFLENFIQSIALNMYRGGLGYVIFGDKEGYNGVDWNKFYVRPVEIHYDESLAEEISEVFADATMYNIILTSNHEIEETGIVLDLSLTIGSVLLLGAVLFVMNKKSKKRF